MFSENMLVQNLVRPMLLSKDWISLFTINEHLTKGKVPEGITVRLKQNSKPAQESEIA